MLLPSYEIQLEKTVRNKGLGKFIMQILQLLAHRYVLHLYVRKVIKIGTLGYTDRVEQY